MPVCYVRTFSPCKSCHLTSEDCGFLSSGSALAQFLARSFRLADWFGL